MPMAEDTVRMQIPLPLVISFPAPCICCCPDMEVDCTGCYFTVSSFICLTENLSEILEFLWRHGCLRKSYLCEKCGKKCAIGDKDLFFRCNRNAVTKPQEQINGLPVQYSQSNHNAIHLPHQEYVLCELYSGVNGEAVLKKAAGNSSPVPGDPLPPCLASPVIGSQYTLAAVSREDCIVDSNSSPQFDSFADQTNATEDELIDPSKLAVNGIKKQRCNFKVSMKKGTFFEKSKLPIDTVCKFVVFWCCMKNPTQEFLRNELSLASRTVVYWSTTCRKICIHWVKTHSEKIGGQGVAVHIDPAIINNKADCDIYERFAFWGMEKDREKARVFIAAVPTCEASTLLKIVNDWILPGSVIMSNCWKMYDCLQWPQFIQQTLTQNKTFVHPSNNSSQNYFSVKSEKGLDEMTANTTPRRTFQHLGDIAELMFKRRYSNHLERIHAFFSQISLAYPLR